MLKLMDRLSHLKVRVHRSHPLDDLHGLFYTVLLVHVIIHVLLYYYVTMCVYGRSDSLLRDRPEVRKFQKLRKTLDKSEMFVVLW